MPADITKLASLQLKVAKVVVSVPVAVSVQVIDDPELEYPEGTVMVAVYVADPD